MFRRVGGKCNRDPQQRELDRILSFLARYRLRLCIHRFKNSIVDLPASIRRVPYRLGAFASSEAHIQISSECGQKGY